jgi:hypothetical protein
VNSLVVALLGIAIPMMASAGNIFYKVTCHGALLPNVKAGTGMKLFILIS